MWVEGGWGRRGWGVGWGGGATGRFITPVGRDPMRQKHDDLLTRVTTVMVLNGGSNLGTQVEQGEAIEL